MLERFRIICWWKWIEIFINIAFNMRKRLILKGIINKSFPFTFIINLKAKCHSQNTRNNNRENRILGIENNQLNQEKLLPCHYILKAHNFHSRTCNKAHLYCCRTSQHLGHGKIHYCINLRQKETKGYHIYTEENVVSNKNPEPKVEEFPDKIIH